MINAGQCSVIYAIYSKYNALLKILMQVMIEFRHMKVKISQNTKLKNYSIMHDFHF